MSEADPHIPNPENNTHQESLFPFNPESVIEGLGNFSTSSKNMLELITYARGPKGAANELYTNLPITELESWHIENGDFTPNGDLLYRAGLLYGVDLATRLAAESSLTSPLVLEDPPAFAKAIDYLKESYRGLEDDPHKPEWLHQKERELLYTGSDILSLANATLNDRVRNLLWDEGVDYHDDELALHVGVVDGAILVDAYRSYMQGNLPLRFKEPVHEYVPVFDNRLHQKGNIAEQISRYNFSGLDEIRILVDGFSQDNEAEFSSKLPLGSVMHSRQRYVQVGTNSFAIAMEVTSIDRAPLSARIIGAFSLMGAAVDVYYMVYQSDLPMANIPISTFMLSGIGYYFERYRRKDELKEYEALGVPINPPDKRIAF